MARPPAISMHRARGASVPSSRRRRIRRPGRARRAAARRPGPRCPRAGPSAPIVPWAAPPGRPHPARNPWRARRLGAASSGPRRSPHRPGMHVNLEKVVGAPARSSAAGRGRPRPSALSFSSRTKVPRVAGRGRGDRILRAALLRGPVVPSREAGARRRGAAPSAARRGAGPGKWGLAVHFVGAVPEPTRRPAKSCGRRHSFALCRFGAQGGERLESSTQTDGQGPVQPRARPRSAGCVPAPRSSGKGTAADLRAAGRHRVKGGS